jgi:hypothetical protein
MTDVRPFPKTNTKEKTGPLLLCPKCNVEMRLFGTEAESDERDLYTFECSTCGGLEVRSVRANNTPSVVIVGANGKSSCTTRTRRSPRAK